MNLIAQALKKLCCYIQSPHKHRKMYCGWHALYQFYQSAKNLVVSYIWVPLDQLALLKMKLIR